MKTSLAILLLAALFPLQPQSLAGEKSLTGEQVYVKGKAALDRGDLVTARRCFEQLLRAKPDFEMAKIQLAQVVVAERELAKIPWSFKTARAEVLPRLELSDETLADAVEKVAGLLEKAGGRAAGALRVEPAPAIAKSRLVSLSATRVKYDDVLEALGYAGGVQITHTAAGLAMREETGARQRFDAGNPAAPDMSGALEKLMLDRFVLEEAEAAGAVTFLCRKAAELSGGAVRPVFVMRHDAAPRSTVSLELRNVSVRDALHAVCLMADLEVKWFPWGAGIGNRQAAAAVTSPPVNEAPAPKPSRP